MATTTPTKEQLEEAYAMTKAAEAAMVTSVEKALTTFNNAITKIVDGMPALSPQSPAYAFAVRAQQNVQSLSGYDLNSLKTQYGLNDPVPAATDGATTDTTTTTA